MVVLHPAVVRFAGARLEGVTRLTVDRSAAREVEAWGDLGPYAVMADVAEQRVTAEVRQTLTREALDGPRPGEAGELVAYTAPAGSDAGRRKLTASAVVRSCVHRVGVGARGGWGGAGRGGGSGGGGGEVAERVIVFVLVSPDGAADPVTIGEAGSEV
ncbi:MAG: hypothetical protein HRU70_08830 [Phycisphaeraceae bacterium]|nr:MAG: hypothetical protein HRU70_08830 [Phycisphaeraceae bacterium]